MTFGTQLSPCPSLKYEKIIVYSSLGCAEAGAIPFPVTFAGPQTPSD